MKLFLYTNLSSNDKNLFFLSLKKLQLFYDLDSKIRIDLISL